MKRICVWIGIFSLFLSFATAEETVVPAAVRTVLYLPMLSHKRVALVVNQTSRVGSTHLADFLLAKGVAVRKIFAPEHGFRGMVDAGAQVKNGRDRTTGLPVISLYGKYKKPTKAMLRGIDIIVFDIQDVGVRFYTYLSTLHYVMEAAAKQHIPLIVLDRPNPNGHYVDGPVLKRKFRSFVGLDPVPVVYGMTIGEYAKMLNGEGWLKGGIKADLCVIRLQGYTHDTPYRLPVKPSPNLPTERAVVLYPSLAFFEGTQFSAGRGTTAPFERYGAPGYTQKRFCFTPSPMPGASRPKHQGKCCYGVDLGSVPVEKIRSEKRLHLGYLIDAYRHYNDEKRFFLNGGKFFDKLAGSDRLRKQLEAGWSEAQIRKSWEADLEKFKKIREKYLLYR